MKKGKLAEFIQDGNFFEGDIAALPEDCSLYWDGSGAKLAIDPTSALVKTKFVLGNKSCIRIGAGSQINGELRADGKSTISIGAGTFFNRPSNIRACAGTTITIGDVCLFSNVKIISGDLHLIFDKETGDRINFSKSIEIGRKVWLSEYVTVYKGVSIGKGSVIGGHSVVVKDIPEESLAAGIPATVKKTGITWQRFKDKSKWVE
jgi:Acetyltransferase (isoleucine patch superfamily)